MGCSVHSPGDHADGVQPEICGLPDGSQRGRNALNKETKTGAQATLAHPVPGRGSEPDILPSAYRHVDEIGSWTEALEVVTEITGMI